jgi:hypothetical protein
VALPVIAAMGLLTALWTGSRLSGHRSSARPVSLAAAMPIPKGDPLPTLSNYEWAANRSPGGLDELLARQAFADVPPSPTYTAATLTLGDGSN